MSLNFVSGSNLENSEGIRFCAHRRVNLHSSRFDAPGSGIREASKEGAFVCGESERMNRLQIGESIELRIPRRMSSLGKCRIVPVLGRVVWKMATPVGYGYSGVGVRYSTHQSTYGHEVIRDCKNSNIHFHRQEQYFRWMSLINGFSVLIACAFLFCVQIAYNYWILKGGLPKSNQMGLGITYSIMGYYLWGVCTLASGNHLYRGGQFATDGDSSSQWYFLLGFGALTMLIYTLCFWNYLPSPENLIIPLLLYVPPIIATIFNVFGRSKYAQR